MDGREVGEEEVWVRVRVEGWLRREVKEMRSLAWSGQRKKGNEKGELGTRRVVEDRGSGRTRWEFEGRPTRSSVAFMRAG